MGGSWLITVSGKADSSYLETKPVVCLSQIPQMFGSPSRHRKSQLLPAYPDSHWVSTLRWALNQLGFLRLSALGARFPGPRGGERRFRPPHSSQQPSLDLSSLQTGSGSRVRDRFVEGGQPTPPLGFRKRQLRGGGLRSREKSRGPAPHSQLLPAPPSSRPPPSLPHSRRRERLTKPGEETALGAALPPRPALTRVLSAGNGEQRWGLESRPGKR